MAFEPCGTTRTCRDKAIGTGNHSVAQFAPDRIGIGRIGTRPAIKLQNRGNAVHKCPILGLPLGDTKTGQDQGIGAGIAKCANNAKRYGKASIFTKRNMHTRQSGAFKITVGC